MTEAEIIAVGTELLTPQRIDTNSLLITEQLNSLGVELIRKQVIGDHRERLTAAIDQALDRAGVVIVIGGLGPTEDDLTRDATAGATGRKLILSPEQEAVLINRFKQLNRPMAKNNLRQAYLVEGAEAMPNPHGTAPGQFLIIERGVVALLPGPPRELRPMVTEQLIPRLRSLVPPQVIRVRTFRIAGMGESDLDALIAPVYTKYDNPVVTILSAPGDLFVIMRATGETEIEADGLLREVGNPIAELLGDRAYTEDGNEPLEAVVGRLLRERQATVAVAESCTGGLLAGRLTEPVGSSDYFIAGYVTYTNEQKAGVLGVPRNLLEQYTAVSEPVAKAMAAGARRLSGATYALATTGYAGPTGGDKDNPVGTVYLGLATPEGTQAIRARYGADRFRIRVLGVQNALDLLRKTLQSAK